MEMPRYLTQQPPWTTRITRSLLTVSISFPPMLQLESLQTKAIRSQQRKMEVLRRPRRNHGWIKSWSSNWWERTLSSCVQRKRPKRWAGGSCRTTLLFKRSCLRRRKNCTRHPKGQSITRSGTRIITWDASTYTTKINRRIVEHKLSSGLRRGSPNTVKQTSKTTRSSGPRAAWTKLTIYSVYLFQDLRKDSNTSSSIFKSQIRICQTQTSPA